MPMMSAGIRSGVNWMRLNEQSMTSASVRTSIVLPRPGHALEQHVAVREQPDERVPDELALADDDLADLGLDGAGALGERLGGEAVRLAGAAGAPAGAVDASMSPPGGGPIAARRVSCCGSSELK